MSVDQTNPLEIAKKLITYPSVSPDTGGTQEFMGAFLKSLDFQVRDMTLGEGEQRTANFFAQNGNGCPALCFAGHSDVVPPGPRDAWDHDPFEPYVRDGYLYGRGACDMKGSIAAFLAALGQLHKEGFSFSRGVSLLITGDEEEKGTFGTKKLLPILQKENRLADFFIVGEPTCTRHVGDVIKVGRRGSMNVTLTVRGVQGHVAYPHKADNPIHRLVDILADLKNWTLDKGTEYFQPSSLQVTSVDVGNKATNVTPGAAVAHFNIRFNDRHTGAALEEAIKKICYRHADPDNLKIDVSVSGEAFITHPGSKVALLQEAIEKVTSHKAKLDTGGGTSDARFIAPLRPVVELGVVGATLHKVNENVAIEDLEKLTRIYKIFMQEMER